MEAAKTEKMDATSSSSSGCMTGIPRSLRIDWPADVDVDVRGDGKFKEGLGMAITASVVAKRDELVQSARLLGKKNSQWTFGERGPDLQVTLADLEQFLRPLMAAMAGGFLAVSAAEQTERLPETRPCPTCGHECSQEERERTIAAEQGPYTWAEPVCHCSQCERAFFPAAIRTQDWPARLQPGDDRQDHLRGDQQ